MALLVGSSADLLSDEFGIVGSWAAQVASVTAFTSLVIASIGRDRVGPNAPATRLRYWTVLGLSLATWSIYVCGFTASILILNGGNWPD